MNSKSRFDALLDDFSKNGSSDILEKLEVVKKMIKSHNGKRSKCVYVALRFLGVSRDEALEVAANERKLEWEERSSFITLS
ncbi:MAG: hypothetical protein ACI37J_07135 [Candidatus Bruticola sp.]